MKAIILKDVQHLTGRYHEDGGLVVIAKDLERAKEMFVRNEISDEEYCRLDDYDKYHIQPTEEEWSKAITYDLKDDNAEETYYVFPDAGCC